jgi:two-component system sensor histidine kinase KdpD
MGRTKRGLEYCAGAAIALAVTGIAFRLQLPLPAISCLYLLLIVLSAMRWGVWEATAVTLAAFLFLDYFFTRPLFSLRIADTANWIALVTFEFVGLLTARLSSQARRQTRIAAAERNNMERLYELSRAVLTIDPREPPAWQIERCIERTMGVTSAAIEEASPVQASAESGAETTQDVRVRPLRVGHHDIGAITLRGGGLSALTADAVASVAAIALERCRVLEDVAVAEAARQGDQLRTAVLDSLAHAFKTPLTTIRVASSGLIEAGLLSPAARDLAALIDNECSQLSELATRLLRTARLDEASVPPGGEVCRVAGLIDEVLERTSVDGDRRLVREDHLNQDSGQDLSQDSGDATCVSGNSELLVVSLMQLVDNALKYSTPGTPVTIAAGTRNGEAVISVHNLGPAIRTEDQKPIFERFYRAPGTEHLAAGTGLGLSITRKIAEAHAGRTWVRSDESSGTTFFLALPVFRGPRLP